jgi:LysM repeat protein
MTSNSNHILKKAAFLLVILLSLSTLTVAQNNELQEVKRVYRNIVEDSINVLSFEENLAPFFEKLAQLENGKINRINIVHIGDSHIQADWLSGTVRKNLQQVFGNGGRGLIFPHKVANSNSAPDIYSFSNTRWEGYRNIHNQSKYDVGISGFVIATEDSAAILKIALNDKDNMGYEFNKLTFLHPMGSEYYEFMLSGANNRDVLEKSAVAYDDVFHKVQSGDYLGKIATKYNTTVSQIKALNGLKSDNISVGQVLKVKKQISQSAKPLPEGTFHDFELICCTDSACTVIELDTLLEFAFMRSMKGYTNQRLMQWDGIVLENTLQSGILYHTIGVNGAMFSHYNKTPRFFEQLPILKPDLIIVSLGTNEALNGKTDAVFDQDFYAFFNNIAQQVDSIPIIITTPPDNRKHPSNADILAQKLVSFAEELGFSVFDLHSILGGKGSFALLQQKNLARADKVHFSANGYIMQGELLNDAILKSYKKFNTTHEPE